MRNYRFITKISMLFYYGDSFLIFLFYYGASFPFWKNVDWWFWNYMVLRFHFYALLWCFVSISMFYYGDSFPFLCFIMGIRFISIFYYGDSFPFPCFIMGICFISMFYNGDSFHFYVLLRKLSSALEMWLTDK